MPHDPLVAIFFAAVGLRIVIWITTSLLIRGSYSEDAKWRWHRFMTVIDTVLLLALSTYIWLQLHQPLVAIISAVAIVLFTVPRMRGVQFCMRCGHTIRSYYY